MKPIFIVFVFSLQNIFAIDICMVETGKLATYKVYFELDSSATTIHTFKLFKGATILVDVDTVNQNENRIRTNGKNHIEGNSDSIFITYKNTFVRIKNKSAKMCRQTVFFGDMNRSYLFSQRRNVLDVVNEKCENKNFSTTYDRLIRTTGLEDSVFVNPQQFIKKYQAFLLVVSNESGCKVVAN